MKPAEILRPVLDLSKLSNFFFFFFFFFSAGAILTFERFENSTAYRSLFLRA